MTTGLDARLAWRAASGRNAARVSLVVRIVGVAFATVVLLLATTAGGALETRGDRTSWRTNPGYDQAVTPEDAWVQVGWDYDYYLDHQVSRVRVAQHSDRAEVPPGLPRFPQPGEVFVSPALARLIERDPEVLGKRYGDVVVGTIDDSGLGDPDELVAIAGVAPPEDVYFGELYRELPTGFNDRGITVFMWLVVTIGVVVLLFPIAMFIASAARLNAQESDARLAALRLAGADPARVRWIVAWEAVIASIPGALLGLALFFAVRPLVAEVEFDGSAFYPGDFALNAMSLAVLLVVPVVVIAASFIGLRDVEISPLGVSRHSTRAAVRPLGFLFLVPGFALLWYVLGLQNSTNGFQQVVGLVVGVFLILAGVAFIGTWLGQVVARLFADRVRSGSALLAFRRIVNDPRASFRTVSGVTFAVFAGTLFLSLSAALEREVDVGPTFGLPEELTVVSHRDNPGTALDGLPEGTAVVRLAQTYGLVGTPDAGQHLFVLQGDCAEIARVLPLDDDCGGKVVIRHGSGLSAGDVVKLGWEGEDGEIAAATVTIPGDAVVFEYQPSGPWSADVILPAGTVENFDDFATYSTAILAPDSAVPGDRGFEPIRTAIMRAFPWDYVYFGREPDVLATSGLRSMRNLVYAGTFAAFALSGGTAAMAVAASIIARRRSFALLRMSGVSLGTLRRTVIAEATLPLLLVSVVSAGTAVAVSALMIERAGQGSVLPPPAFVLPLLAGLAIGLLLPMMTLPLLDRSTRMQQTRFD